MKLALGIIFLWVGGAALFLASHGMEASSPWGAFNTLLTKIGSADATGVTNATPA